MTLPDKIKVVYDLKNDTFECSICLTEYRLDQELALNTGYCDHRLCQDCLRGYLNQILTDTQYEDYALVQCPGTNCERHFLSNEVVPFIFSQEEAENWWLSALSSKAYIANKVHCPHDGCAGVFMAEDEDTKKCTFSECGECHRGLCITCQTPWHPEIMKVTNDEDELKKALKTFKDKNWCKCPSCGNFVERSSGCDSMICRCNFYFCYRCGGKMAGYGKCLNRCMMLTLGALMNLREKMYQDVKK